MGRFNTGTNKAKRPGPQSAIQTKKVTGSREPARVRTALGAQGYQRDARSELFLLAVSFMGGDKLLHESSNERYNRLLMLCNDDTVFGDEVWCYNFVNYLRNDAQLRTVAIVVACEIVRSRLSVGMYGGNVYPRPRNTSGYEEARTPRNRQIIDIACARADEPAEVLAYWTSKYGQSKYDGVMIPQPILNGVGDAAVRLWNEFSVLKYGGGNNKSVTMKDVLRLARPTPKDSRQAALFGWVTGTVPFDANVGPLPLIAARQKMNSIPRDERISYLFGDSNVAR